MAEQNNQLAAALSKKLKKDGAEGTGAGAEGTAGAAGSGKNGAGEKDKRSIVLDVVEDATGIEREDLEGSKRLGDDLNIDSLSLMDIAVRLEEEFGVEVPDEDINRVKTIDELVGLVDK
ncbi:MULTISPECIES: acyl carrier protein [unclassified Corynebacterium]|uniref:acyl carrier protein n=1 Tax=unclassified Corynebacterium TaxID=2624378 RepID=UPI001EF5D131|nr:MULTISPECIES: phosphopantetheine-binding protein [unclassified Corynebacterium]MCG7258842.1 phosphopantetheine-binding protein [Corynebacterium sp. ACRQK]MCG7263218.1 phosphopantetheine-binding protein [Corynebacterium sp. ACRQL]